MENLVATTHTGENSGSIEKLECHSNGGILHKAFSVFLFDELGRLCLQQRSDKKMLWPLAWSNSCCSHPHWNEKDPDAVKRRIFEELGCHATQLSEIFIFSYEAAYLKSGHEKELCAVWVGQLVASEIQPNYDEVAAVAFLYPSDVSRALSSSPAQFTPWFSIEWPVVSSHLTKSV